MLWQSYPCHSPDFKNRTDSSTLVPLYWPVSYYTLYLTETLRAHHKTSIHLYGLVTLIAPYPLTLSGTADWLWPNKHGKSQIHSSEFNSRLNARISVRKDDYSNIHSSLKNIYLYFFFLGACYADVGSPSMIKWKHRLRCSALFITVNSLWHFSNLMLVNSLNCKRSKWNSSACFTGE